MTIDGFMLQKNKLLSLYNDKVENLVKRLLILGDSEGEVSFQDFLWANSIFWTRALTIPLPRSYVFPQSEEAQQSTPSSLSGLSTNHISKPESATKDNGKRPEVNGNESQVAGVTPMSIQGETVWVEGLVPGIDFCNHDLKAAAIWEVDGSGATTGVPNSMYLLSVEQVPLQIGKEISISYGNKGNEELLYLYGFIIENNPDDYIMVHYPGEAIHRVPFSESKIQLLEAQKAEMRCLLHRNLLGHGFFPASSVQKETDGKCRGKEVCNYSWSGQRKMPSYLNKLVFPDDFLTSLRTIAMREEELYQVSSLLEELVGPGGDRQPSDTEVRAAIWEACGDSGALQMLVDLLNMRMAELEQGSGTEESDTKLLKEAECTETLEDWTSSSQTTLPLGKQMLSRNKWASIVYRRGQKQLTRLFLKEAEHALQLALSEGN